MFCKNCGKEIDPQAAFCSHCGCKNEQIEQQTVNTNGFGERYCSNCGTKLEAGAEVCLSCGFSTKSSKPAQPQAPANAKSKLVAGLFGLFLGGFGVHNFYLGYTGKGIAQILLSCTGISAVWALVESILIFCGKIPDADGNPLVD